jgi:hypothetical protein
MSHRARPLALQRAIARQLAKDDTPAAPPRPMPGSWEAFVGDFRAQRRVLSGPPDAMAVYTLALPGLELVSLNRTTRGRERIAWQHRATDAARAALMASPDLPRIAFTRPVRIIVTSRMPAERIDADNLSRKELIDCLTERGGGLGIIPDDNPRWVRYVGGGYASATGPACVWLDIREAIPVEEDDGGN